ncbi:MAG: hypothetical protein KKA79_02045 [Nanoarchaeota archaeon]|nr:hypothetical protein [Nanoarchaeota archaeon]
MEQLKLKPKIAIESVTGCAGCQLEIYFQEYLMEILENFELVSAPMIKGKNEYAVADIIFIEGTIVNEEDMERVKAMREKCKILVAIGECACHGCMPTMNYSQNKKNIDVIKSSYENPSMLKDKLKNIDPVPIDKIVKVDYYIKGCPMDKKEFENFVKDFLLGKKIQQFNQPLCYYCNLRENECILEKGGKCLGPVTDGNCSVMCPSYGIGCTGCRGFIEDSNLNAFNIKMKYSGFSEEDIQNNLHKYAVLQYEEYFKIQNPNPMQEKTTIEEKPKIEEKKEELPAPEENKNSFWKRIFEKRKNEAKLHLKKEKQEIKTDSKKKVKKTTVKKPKIASKSKTSTHKKEKSKKKPTKGKQLNIFEAIRLRFSKKKK